MTDKEKLLDYLGSDHKITLFVSQTRSSRNWEAGWQKNSAPVVCIVGDPLEFIEGLVKATGVVGAKILSSDTSLNLRYYKVYWPEIFVSEEEAEAHNAAHDEYWATFPTWGY